MGFTMKQVKPQDSVTEPPKLAPYCFYDPWTGEGPARLYSTLQALDDRWSIRESLCIVRWRYSTRIKWGHTQGKRRKREKEICGVNSTN